jgi:transposase
LTVTKEERERLQSLAHRPGSQAFLARRARVVLACAEGQDNKAVAKKLRCSVGMVGKWRTRFLKSRLEGLYDEPRPGAPRKVGDEKIEAVVIQTLESTPQGQTHWSTRELAKASGLSRMTISRISSAFGLQPHRAESFKLSPDPLLIEKVRDIVGLYMNPPDHALVFCVGEKSPDSGPGSHPAYAAHATGTTGAAHPRLQTPWHDLAVCRVGIENQPCNRAVTSPPPVSGISQIP